MQKILIKKQIAYFFNFLKIWRLRASAGRGDVLLMYHRVYLPKEDAAYIEPGMYVTPTTFDMHLRFLKKYFCLVPLEELLAPPSSKKGPKARCALTFDDAWRDFYLNAFPLLKKYQVPATLFVPTGFIGSNRWFWTDRLARLIFLIYSNRERWSGTALNTPLGRDIFESKTPIGETIATVVSQLKAKHQQVIEQTLQELESDFGLLDEFNEPAFLDWNEIASLSHSPYVTIGSHTDRHLILTNCSDDEIYLELTTSKQKLVERQAVNPEFLPFCYPNGNYNPKIARMVAEVGYDLAVSTETGWSPFNTDRFALKRIGLHEDISNTPGMLACRIAGIF